VARTSARELRIALAKLSDELARRCVSVCLGLEPLPQGR
jgi:hypothetical protein